MLTQELAKPRTGPSRRLLEFRIGNLEWDGLVSDELYLNSMID